MRILMDARTFGEKPSGIGIYGYNFIVGLLEYAPQVELVLITDVAESKEMQYLQERQVPIHVLGYKITKSLALSKYFRYVQSVIHEVQPDVFWEINNLFPIKIHNPYGKIVITVHDMFPITMPGCFGRIYPYYFRYGMRNTLKYADAILYNSDETRKDTERYFPKAAELPNKLLYIVLPKLRDAETDDDIQEAYPQEKYLLYIGNLEKRKGTDILLEGYRIYRKLGGTRALYLGGSVREEDIQKQMDEIMAKEPGLHYVGYVTEGEKKAYLKHADGFVFPSRAEGFGIPVLEAMEYDCPVLLSNLSIFHEIIGDVAQEINMNEELKQSARELADAMLEMERKEAEKNDGNQQVLQRYRAEVLIPSLVEYLESLTKD